MPRRGRNVKKVMRAHVPEPNTHFAPQHRCQLKQWKNFQLQNRVLKDEEGDFGTVGSTHLYSAASGLTVDQLHILQGFVAEAQQKAQVFYQAADKNRKCFTYTNFVVLCIMGLTTISSTLFNIFSVVNDSTFWYRIVFNVLIFISTILKAAQVAFAFEQKAFNYEVTADDFHSYEREWTTKLKQGVDDRADKCTENVTIARLTIQAIEDHALPL